MKNLTGRYYLMGKFSDYKKFVIQLVRYEVSEGSYLVRCFYPSGTIVVGLISKTAINLHWREVTEEEALIEIL